ncbi:S phase cyclin A-associated protein in the endoplasmic reticulum-like isoform X1 [Rhopilema esculentum]|uniref:S phase cyclin A-associated protein in the endoplasmic reticulum-like isoform X1 n=1 Tax=Rhopilema esculentum TaxID=499914 RepID=UPI0031D0AB04
MSMKTQHHGYTKQSPTGMHSNWSGSRDNVRKIVEKEGRIARNLITWSVPIAQQRSQNEDQNQRGKKKYRGRNRGPRNQNRYEMNDHQDVHSNRELAPPNHQVSHTQPTNIINQNLVVNRETKSEEYREHIKNVIENGIPEIRRPSSAQGSKRDNLRARYWSYLFDNLQRAVDEIYKTCDNDESTVECEEVIMMLDSCKKDFVALIDRIKIFKEIENKDLKNRPQSLAWEVRKMSPGKCISPPPAVIMVGRHSPIFNAQKSLNFGNFSLVQKDCSPSAGLSWADKVKGLKATPSGSPKSDQQEGGIFTSEKIQDTKEGPMVSFEAKPSTKSVVTGIEEDGDDEGWEIVGKGKHRSRGSSSVSIKTSASQDSIEILSVKIDEQFSSHTSLSSNERLIGTGSSAFEKVEKSPKSGSASAERIHLRDDSHKKIAEEVKSNFGLPFNDGLASRKIGTNEESLDETTEDSALQIGLSDTGNFEELLLEDEIDSFIETAEQQEEDLISRQMEEENKKALASAIEEEEHLTKELEDEALKNMEDELTEDVSSDKEGNNTDEGIETPRDRSDAEQAENPSKTMTWEEILAQYENEQNEKQDEWADLSEGEPARPPGRALEMHQRLSSPSRTRPRAESVRISEERMVKAERKRLKLLEAKCARLRVLSENVRKVRALKNKIINNQQDILVEKMTKAEHKRQLMLKEKIKKAQVEEAKVNEIAFINSLEAQNKKIEVQEKHQFMEARLQDIMEERQRKREGQQAKEEAAQERRRALEAERRARLEEIKLKRLEQEIKRKKEKQERERAREEAIKERQRDREMKVAARNEALEKAAEELQKKIELKQLESSRRHEERIELVKEKAASSSRHTTVEEAPSIVPYERKKQCTLCNVEILSEVFLVSHLKGGKHRESVKEINKKITEIDMEGFSMKYIKDMEDTSDTKQKEIEENLKSTKKRLKKIKSRMNQRGREYEASLSNETKSEESPKRARLQRSLKEINKLLQTQGNTFWPANKVTSLDRALIEITKLLEGKEQTDQRVFCNIGGIAVLTRILLLVDLSVDILTTKPVITDKILVHTCELLSLACHGNPDSCQYMLLTNKLSTIIDLLNYRSEDVPIKDTQGQQVEGNLSTIIKPMSNDLLVLTLLETLTTITRMLNVSQGEKAQKGVGDNAQRVSDLVSYFVCCGALGKYYKMFQCLQEPLEDTSLLTFYQRVIEMLQGIVLALARLDGIFSGKKSDATGLLQFFKSTHLLGLLSLMYALLHSSGSARVSPSPFPLSDVTVAILTAVLRLINLVAFVDVKLLQDILGSEGNCLQFRSVANYILRYCSTQSSDDLLAELVIAVGNFTVLNKENQGFIQTGRAPTILQQLCLLPFSYFSDPKLQTILLPTLIACCFESQENRITIEQEISCTLLSAFIEDNIKNVPKDADAIKVLSPLSGEGLFSRAALHYRFPRLKYEEAAKFFSKPPGETVIS